MTSIFGPPLRGSKSSRAFLKNHLLWVAKKYLNISNKASAITPAENKAFQASELPQGHTSLEEQIQSDTQDFMAPIEEGW